ncbi:Dapk2 [Symbiodinium sp. CCMP2456]|nr:Dapk2 [Symbiodinium sp. CCMP2456]
MVPSPECLPEPQPKVDTWASMCSTQCSEVLPLTKTFTVEQSWMPDFDSFCRESIPAMEQGRFNVEHVVRSFSEESKAQIEIMSDRTIGGRKVLAKRFPRAYLQDDPESFRTSDPCSCDDPWTEVFLAMQLGHGASRVPGVVPCHGVYRDSREDVLLMLEWAPGGDLFQLAGNLGELGPDREATASQVLCSLLAAVTTLHSKGIAHGNVSAENAILRMDGAEIQVALIDFAMALHDTDLSAVTGARGKLMYRAPETVGEQAIYDARTADLFACGVVGYVLATGTYPWQSTTSDCKAFAYVQKHGPKRFFEKRTLTVGASKVQISQVLSPHFQSVLASLIEPDPAKRRVLWEKGIGIAPLK